MAASLIPRRTALRFGLLNKAIKTQLARKETNRKNACLDMARSSKEVRDKLSNDQGERKGEREISR